MNNDRVVLNFLTAFILGCFYRYFDVQIYQEIHSHPLSVLRLSLTSLTDFSRGHVSETSENWEDCRASYLRKLERPWSSDQNRFKFLRHHFQDTPNPFFTRKLTVTELSFGIHRIEVYIVLMALNAHSCFCLCDLLDLRYVWVIRISFKTRRKFFSRKKTNIKNKVWVSPTK